MINVIVGVIGRLLKVRGIYRKFFWFFLHRNAQILVRQNRLIGREYRHPRTRWITLLDDFRVYAAPHPINRLKQEVGRLIIVLWVVAGQRAHDWCEDFTKDFLTIFGTVSRISEIGCRNRLIDVVEIGWCYRAIDKDVVRLWTVTRFSKLYCRNCGYFLARDLS